MLSCIVQLSYSNPKGHNVLDPHPHVGDFGLSKCYASYNADGPHPNFHCDDDWNIYQCMYDVGDCCDSVIRAEVGCTDCICVEDGLVHPIQVFTFIIAVRLLLSAV